MKKWTFASTIFLLFFPIFSHAQIRPVGTITLGSDSAYLPLNQSITILAPFQNSYIGAHDHDAEFVGGIFLGGEFSLPCHWSDQLGISYYQNSAFNAAGNINQFADPVFNNLTYQFNVQSKRILIETKLLATLRQFIHPFFTAGLGEAINKSYGYNEIPITSDAVPMSDPFGSRTYHSFTYTVGLGVDFDLTQHTRFGLAYRYADVGKAGLGTTPLQESDTTLTFNHLHINEYLLQFTLLG